MHAGALGPGQALFKARPTNQPTINHAYMQAEFASRLPREGYYCGRYENASIGVGDLMGMQILVNKRIKWHCI